MKMETKITLTFMIMFVVSVIISGIQEVVVWGKNFFTLGMWTDALFCASIYLIYIWINTRKHKRLANLAFFVALILMLLFTITIGDGIGVFSTTSNTESVFSGFSILRTIFMVVKVVYFFVASRIAERQAEELLEEDAVNVNVNITLTDNTKPNPEDLSD